MKHIYRISHIFSLILVISFLFPNTSLAQKAELEVELFVSCVEDLGNDTLVAYFGYENPNQETVTVQAKKSYIAYNYTRDIKYVTNTFEPGVHDKVFSQVFPSDDWVRWTVKFSNYTKLTLADSTSSPCVGKLPIIPGYEPPVGGKQYLSKIGAELTSLYNAYSLDPDNFTGATDDIFQLVGTKVFIEVYAYNGQYAGMIYSLDSLGFDQLTANPGLKHATGWLEIADLLKLNDFVNLFYARPVYPGVPNYIVPPTGVTKSQGDFAMHSDFARLGFEVNGSGVKIGVLSNSYNSQNIAHVDVQNGDLPGATNPRGFSSEVQVLKDIAPNPTPLSDEGRAMLQIVHDIAPGAQLGFRTGYLGELDMAQGIRELADSGYHVIVDDLSYVTEPYFRDGIISQTIDSVVSEGVSFFSSAGNFGRTSFSAFFDSEPAPSTITGTAHDFSGTGDIFQSVSLPEGSYMMVLQWDDGSDPTMNTTTTDLDLFLSDDAGFALLGFNRENIGAFPIEVVPFSVVGDTVISNIVIARAAGPDVPVRFKYILFRGGSQFKMLEFGDQGNSTIVGHPNAAGAISVGAVRFDKNPVYSPGLYPVPVIMSFSSVGGTPVNGNVRAKPDITAPNGVNTTVDLGNGDWIDPIDPDTLFPNFFGTSAASPHAAGVAALIIEAKAKFDSVSTVSPDTIRALLKGSALDMETPGDDHISGSGFIQAHKALMNFANPTPYIANLINITDSISLGEEITPFSFTVTGDFFTDFTQILFRGEALDSGVVFTDEYTIIVNHPGFLGNPDIQAYTPPISSSDLDGGYSEVKHFSDSVKQKVIITANNVSKKYGEELPEFTAHILVITVDDDSLTLEQAVLDGIVLQAEADRFSGLSYGGPATDTSDASIYIITPALDPVLDLDSIPNEVDFAISEKYILEFVNGNLVVEKLALKITPHDVSIGYGDELPAAGLAFDYEIGDSTVVLGDSLFLVNSVQGEHMAALTNEIALVRGIAMVNGIPMIRGIAMVNGVTMVRGIALVNGVEVKVEVVGADTTVYVAGEAVVNAGTQIRGIAMVNGLPFVSMTEIVRGIALVNGDKVTFDEGYMTELNGVPLENAVPAIRGIAMVNGGANIRGIALVNGIEVVIENGVTTIDGQTVPTEGIVQVLGIPVVRGIALVNSSLMSRGIALVNGLEIPIENGIPNLRGIAMVNGLTVRGIAMVNGIPMHRGIALVNNLEVEVIDGEVSQVHTNDGSPVIVNMSRGIAMVNGIALVNGFYDRGISLVNGIALVNAAGSGDDVLSLENMNLMAGGNVLANSISSVRGIALVNGIEGLDGFALKSAAESIQPDGSVLNVSSGPRGIALVNGQAFARGIALVNNEILPNGIALVNSSTIDENSNSGSIMVFDATDIGAPPESVSVTPISFITGTTAGQHWIVPGTFLSNNYEITYGLGSLTIDPADLSIDAIDASKTYGQEDPELYYLSTGLLAEDTITGELNRETGEDAGDYYILQGSLSAGENYIIHYDSATFTIDPALLTVSVVAEDKVYDGDREAVVALFDTRLNSDTLDISYTSALFDDKNVGEDKVVTVLGISVTGADAGNYQANTTATDSADITTKELVIGITADDKDYDGNTAAGTQASITSGLVPGDIVTVSSFNGSFDTKHVGTGKSVSASVSSSGDDAGNYTPNTTASATASISAIDLVIGITADDKDYDGNYWAVTQAVITSGLVSGDIVSVTSSNGMFDNKDVGSWGVTANVSALGSDAGNYLANTSASTTANITPKEVNVSLADPFLIIREGDPLPVFAFTYLGWIPGDAGNESYTVLRDSDGAMYDPESSVSSGTYTVTPEPINSNYTYMVEVGVMHVNPYGPGTRAIKPVLNCIEMISPNYYVANFEYKNENDERVIIPLGDDNFLSGSGIDWANSDEVPTIFEPGGGSFMVFFDGSELSWTVNSRDGDQKVSNAANANSSSTKCKGNSKKSATVSSIFEGEPGLDPDQLMAYPNPVTDKVHITMKDIEKYKMILLYDFTGRSHSITSIDKRTDQLEIDMAQLAPGHYFIRIEMEDTTRVVPIIKQ